MHPILETYKKVNAFGRLLGMDFEVVKPGEVTYHMDINAEHLSNPHAAHGGALAAMMDGVLGVAALSLSVEDNELVSTVEFKLNYYRPVKPGMKLEGRGKVVYTGKKLLSAEGHIYSTEDRKLLCSGLGTFNRYPVEKNPDLF